MYLKLRNPQQELVRNLAAILSTCPPVRTGWQLLWLETDYPSVPSVWETCVVCSHFAHPPMKRTLVSTLLCTLLSLYQCILSLSLLSTQKALSVCFCPQYSLGYSSPCLFCWSIYQHQLHAGFCNYKQCRNTGFFFLTFLWWWRWNPGPHTCKASVLTVTYWQTSPAWSKHILSLSLLISFVSTPKQTSTILFWTRLNSLLNLLFKSPLFENTAGNHRCGGANLPSQHLRG